jgi:CHAT domain-containing protein
MKRWPHIVCSLGALVLSVPPPGLAADPARYSSVDCWTHTRNLETKKGYQTLAVFLASIATNFFGATDLLTLRPEQLAAIWDKEGLCYLLDDLAEVYAVGVIDFRKAEHFNNLAEAAFNRVRNAGLETLPVSLYFNSRRSLYYFVNLSDVDKLYLGSTNSPSVSGLFPHSMLVSVRQEDFARLGQRIENRRKLLLAKLGNQPKESKAEPPPVDAARATIQQHLSQRVQTDNDYYRSFYAAQRIWEEHLSGARIDFEMLRTVSEDALRLEPTLRDQTDIDSANWLLHWAGFANLKLNRHFEGVRWFQQFLWATEERDNLELAAENERRRVMGKAVDELKKRWESVSLIIGIGGTLAGSVVALQAFSTVGSAATVAQANAAVEAVQRAALQSAIISVSSMSASRFTDSVGDFATDTRADQLLRKITRFNLQVGRYLNQFEQVEIYSLLGEAYEQLRDTAKAIRYYKEALNLIELQRSTIATEDARINFFLLKENLYPRIVDLLVATGNFGEAFEFVERSRARAFLDLIFSRESLLLRSSEDTARLAQEALQRRELAALLAQRNFSPEQFANAARNLPLPPDPDVSSIGFLIQSQTAGARDIEAMTRDGIAILEYFVGIEKVYSFCLSDGKLTVTTLPVRASDLRSRVRSFYDAISNDRGTYRTVTNDAKKLYDSLIRPLEDRIADRSLVIVPHNVLHYLPFGALRSDRGFLVERHTISLAPSASIFKLLLDRKLTAAAVALVLANPEGPGELPGTLHEASAIAEAMKDARICVGKEASETILKSFAHAADVVHLAAHAVFNHGDPLASAVLLARDTFNDGSLRAEEMYQLQLKPAVIVLSGCETGLSSFSQGDELIGLTRPLMYAGAGAIVASLWRVGDQATAELMSEFYKGLKDENFHVGLSLRKAQLSVMHRYPKPFFWAGFTVTAPPQGREL